MGKEWIGIVLSIIFCLIVISIVIIFFGRKKYLKRYGIRYNKILELNRNNTFPKKVYKYTKFVYVDSKKKLDNINMLDIALNSFANNEGNVKSNYLEFIDESKDYNNYVNEYNKIMAKEVSYSSNKFKEYEYKKCLKKFKKFNNSFIFKISASYISPKKKKQLIREITYNINDILAFPIIINQREDYKESKKYQRDLMTDSLRFKVLKRDGYRCRICGISANEGAILEVDHIIPISKRGKSTIDNLQTLCKSCNRGKSDKDY